MSNEHRYNLLSKSNCLTTHKVAHVIAWSSDLAYIRSLCMPVNMRNNVLSALQGRDSHDALEAQVVSRCAAAASPASGLLVTARARQLAFVDFAAAATAALCQPEGTPACLPASVHRPIKRQQTECKCLIYLLTLPQMVRSSCCESALLWLHSVLCVSDLAWASIVISPGTVCLQEKQQRIAWLLWQGSAHGLMSSKSSLTPSPANTWR